MKSWFFCLPMLAVVVALCGCIGPPRPLTAETQQALRTQPPIRFVLSFDDGPSAAWWWNSTAQILDSLADNPVLPGIKGVFFVQSRSFRAGGSEVGQALMHREHAEGHVLGLHTATTWHSNHRFLSPQALEQSLANGSADIAAITAAPPVLVRPPFWNYDRRTFAAYQRHGLHILLTDLSANDGKVWGFNGSPQRRANMLKQLAQVREEIAQGHLPVVDGVIPLVVTFHDVNSYSARHIQEYLQILLDSAREAGIPTAPQPFYTERAALLRAVMARTVQVSGEPVQLPGLWGWLWNGDGD